jgi:hypothetical protein
MVRRWGALNRLDIVCRYPTIALVYVYMLPPVNETVDYGYDVSGSQLVHNRIVHTRAGPHVE